MKDTLDKYRNILWFDGFYNAENNYNKLVGHYSMLLHV